MPPKITVDGKEYDSFEDLPPEVKARIQQGFQKLKNIPFAKSMFKMSGMDINTLNNGQIGTGAGSDSNTNDFGNLQNGNTQFKTSFSLNTANNPFGSNDPFKKNSRGGGAIAFVTIAFIVGIIGFIYGINALTSSWEETFELKSDTKNFNPYTAINDVRSHIDPNAKLSEINVSYIRSDGTMDLTATNYNPRVEYKFYRELAEPPKDAPPVGAGGTLNGKWYEPVEAEVYEPGQWRHVTKMGGNFSSEYSYSNKGIDLDRSSPTTSPSTFVADPKCQIKDFWKEAIKKGAPSNAVATLDYDHSGYEFRISDADIHLDFDLDCKLKE